MKYSLKTILLVSMCSIVIVSCGKVDSNEKFTTNKGSDSLFTVMSAKETNIKFRNILKESTSMNGLMYEYFYNGAGVAVGDLNGDDLPDIYFISNLKSNKLYVNQGNLNFLDATDPANVKGKYGFPTGVTMVDINEDGKLDIYISKSGKFNDPNKRRNELYINKGNNAQGIPLFEEKAEAYGLDLPHFSTQASFFDYDRDGDLDMFLLNHGILLYADESIEDLLNTESQFRGERLYRNDNSKFVDVTKEAGIINNLIGFGLGLSVGDLNNDGWPDVIVGHDYSEKDHMYINQQNGKFKEVIKETTSHVSNFSMGNDMADFNNDGMLDFIALDMMSEHNYDIKTSMSGMNPARFYKHVDLGLHHQYMYNTLQINNGAHNDLPRFSDIAQLSGVSSTDWSWGPLLFDMDNDGLKDLFVANGIKGDFRNNDFVNYRKHQQQRIKELKEQGKKIDMQAYITDIMSKMPSRKKVNYFFKNNGDLTFSNKSEVWGGELLTSSNGSAYADLDNDGDLDIIVNNSDDASFIYRNNSTDLELGHYLKIKLKGSAKNKLGIGARLIATQNDKNQVLEQYLTRGFQSSVSQFLHFGMGDDDQLEKLEIIWPDGNRQTLNNIEVDQLITLDYLNSKPATEKPIKESVLFADVTEKLLLKQSHQENAFNDFEKESLLPHKMSNFGPGLAVGDVNGDGMDDFYVGGAKGFNGALYLQKENQSFVKFSSKTWEEDASFEDLGAAFFDADNDGDMDLYVVSGGNEFEEGSKELQDRIYQNDGSGNFIKTTNSLPQNFNSGSVVKPFDYDGDGDQDLFVGGRLVPGKYPFPASSSLLMNESSNGKIIYKDVTKELIPDLEALGMITDAEWVDVTGDQKMDLVIVGEWTPIQVFQNGTDGFENITDVSGLANQTGWWFSISSADMDNDGDMDLVAGNLGLNYKYKASYDAPFEVYSTDFDENGTIDIVLSYYDLGKLYPLRGRSCSSSQMPFIKKKFPTYNDFGSATLIDVYGDALNSSLSYSAKTFATTYFENLGDGKFKATPLPNEAQFSSVNDILLDDVNNDGHKDILIAGNLYASEIETPRNDASFGLLLSGNGKGEFSPISATESGIYIQGDTKNMRFIGLNNNTKKGILIAKNNDYMQLIQIAR